MEVCRNHRESVYFFLNKFSNPFLITTEAQKWFCIVSLLHWINKSWLPHFLVGNDNLRCGIWSELNWIYSEYIIRNDIDWQGIKGPNVIKESVWLWRLSLCSCQKVMVIFYVMLSEFWVVGGLNMNCWGRRHFYVYSAAVW